MRGEQAIFNLEIKKKSRLSIKPDIHHSKVFSSGDLISFIKLLVQRLILNGTHETNIWTKNGWIPVFYLKIDYFKFWSFLVIADFSCRCILWEPLKSGIVRRLLDSIYDFKLSNNYKT